MSLTVQFSDDALTTILDQSSVYTCACPAQLCKAIMQQRMLHRYQAGCVGKTYTDEAVHAAIAHTVEQVHAALEGCLDEVLRLEGWDMGTYVMPESLQKQLACEVDEGSR